MCIRDRGNNTLFFQRPQRAAAGVSLCNQVRGQERLLFLQNLYNPFLGCSIFPQLRVLHEQGYGLGGLGPHPFLPVSEGRRQHVLQSFGEKAHIGLSLSLIHISFIIPY